MKLLDLLAIKGLEANEKERRMAVISHMTDEVAKITQLEKRI